MKIEIIELLLVISIVAAQTVVFRRTLSRIRLFKNAIPDIDSLRIARINIPSTDYRTLSPKEILRNAGSYGNADRKPPTSDAEDASDESERLIPPTGEIEGPENQCFQIDIIEATDATNEVFDNVLASINTYLIRNRTGAADFSLIKDIVERNTDNIEEEINSSMGIPLYLGLMGTMMGIVIGLFNMPALDSIKDSSMMDSGLNQGISLLIGGVKIAMIASFVGLFFTILLTGWYFKGARSFIEGRKNAFYTMIQVELLPMINQGLGTTLESLQRNLLRFNHEFSENLLGLKGIFDSSRNAIKEQKELIDAIDRAKVSDMTKYNVSVLKQLSVSVTQFEKFNQFLENLTQFVGNTRVIVDRTNELLDRTGNFETIAQTIQSKLDQSQLLFEFLSSHFADLEEHKKFTSHAIADVGHSISETFKQLQEQIQVSSEAVKQFTVDETDLLKKALSEGKTNLANLEHLESLKSDVALFKNSSASQGERLRQALDELNRNMAASISILEQIEQRDSGNWANGITTYLKRLLKPKQQGQ